MAETTGIGWCDSTANLWIGCSKVSPGCDHCYAAAEWADRRKRVVWGAHGTRSPVKAGWELIRKMHNRAIKNGGIDPTLGRRRRIFINSLSDFFDNHRSIDPQWRADACARFEMFNAIDYILVTKRPENVRKMVPAHWLEQGGWPAHVWLLVSVEDQERANHRVPILIDLPVPVKGVSAEPLLGPINFRHIEVRLSPDYLTGRPGERHAHLDALNGWYLSPDTGYRIRRDAPSKLNWVICGGEQAREFRDNGFEANARSIKAQCRDAAVPFFGKQNCGKPGKLPLLPDELLGREFPQ